jgi:general secretion pathway protein C
MLDLFFRKYAWTANLALLLLGALFTARIANTLVGALIRPRPHAELVSAAPAAPRYAPPVNFDDQATATKLYHLIGTEPPAVAVADAAPAKPARPQNCADPFAQPVRSDLKIGLVAAVLAERPSQSLATLADPATRETKVVGVGDEIGGARFLGLERLRADNDITHNAFRMVAVVCNDGTKEYVEPDATSGVEVAANMPNLGTAPLPPRPIAPPGGGMEGVRTVGQNRYEIDRQVIDSTLGDLNKIAMQARIVPSFKNGVANGFKLFSIQPGSLYSAIGIENGDVIQRINGYEINSPEKALELYQKLRESSHVSMEIEHNGQPVKKEYTITGQ